MNRARRQGSEDIAHRRPCLIEGRIGGNDEVGALALLRVGQLVGKDAQELLGSHAGPDHGPHPLGFGIGGDHRDLVHALGQPFFEEQRHVEHDHRRVRMRCKKRLALARHRRMDQSLKPGQFVRLAQHAFGEAVAVDPVRPGGAREMRLDLRDQHPFRSLQAVHRGIGVEHRHAFIREHSRDGRFAHADGAGESQDDRHDVSSSFNSASC